MALQFDYAGVKEMLTCLGEVLDRPEWTFSMGETRFSAHYAVDGYYYLFCTDNIILRLSESEAITFRRLLSGARESLDLGDPAP